MRIEKAKSSDITNISKVELGSGYHKNRRFNPLPMLKRIFNDKKDNIFIIKEKGKIIAYITLREDKNIGEVGLFAVLKKQQERGIGRRLLKYILQIAKKDKLKKLVLEVRNDNLKALNLYSKYGFVVIGTRKVKNIIKLKMERVL
ncbi:MAG: GNAT family N-acetyltransferase [Nanoarchaeota archaeon]